MAGGPTKVGVMSGAEASLWEEVLRKGPMGLSRLEMEHLAFTLPDGPRVIVKRLFEMVEDQTRWIVERTAAMRDEAERVALIGRTMQAAGLRSYTDEKGRIFVAAQRQGDE